MSNKEKIGVTLNVDAEVSKAKSSIESLSKVFDGVGGSKGNQLRNILADIGNEYEKLADESGKTMTKLGDFSKAEKSTSKLSHLFGKLEKEINNIGKMSTKDLVNLFPEDIANKVEKASDAIKTFNTILESSGKGKGAISQATKEYEAQEKAVRKAVEAVEDLEKIKNGTSKKQIVTFNDKEKFSIKVEEAKAKADELKKAYKALRTEMDNFEREERENAQKKGKESMFDKGTQNYSQPYRELRDKVAAAEQEMNKASKTAKDLNQELKNMVVVSDLENDLKSAQAALAEAQNKAALLKKNLDSVSASEFNRALDEAKKKLQGLSGIDLSQITNLDDLNKLFNDFTNEGVEGLKRGLQQAGIEIKELDNVNDQLVTSVDGATAALKKQNQVLDDINGIKNRILQFFSLTEGMQLAHRVVSQATEAIRELDKAMTETATVTDFSVGDMWEALPRYTQAANELGATTLGAYETMTLFYQQGLDTNEVFEIGTETMKMARIAGLEYAEATDLMTAALRGFNMELNETSAQRVNDVYSELAAITAADTEEIANAMTKTASIANSANMEFETTAALLSQIVETTREPAETAGTAMKTIIARFTEMKKATSDIIDVDGEEVDVNKVEAALKSAGVALRDVNGEFRDLDDVFLELASRWDSLDMMTQRYVATMAAGSRQQSRFIAMMSDYDRTMELVDAAYDSAGASAKQFAKTQDSFEAKTNNLKNAWNEYLLSLANSDVVKGVIDLLTKLINVINDLTEGGGSFQSSMLKVFTAVAGFKAIGSMFGQVFSQLPTIFTQEGQSLGNALGQGIQTGVNNIKINFPFIGTLKKELKIIQQEVKEIESKGVNRKTNFGDLGELSKSGKISNAVKQMSGELGNQMNTYLQGQLKKVNLTDEGADLAKEVIDGFVNNLRKDGNLDAALNKLQQDIDNKLGGPSGINVRDANFDPKSLEKVAQKANEASMALSSLGMLFSSIGSKLSQQSGALGKFGHGLEVVGNSASMAGMALMTVTTVTKALDITLSKSVLGIIAVAAGAISFISGIISKQKELKKEAQQLTLDTANEKKEEAEANRELANSLEDTIEAYKNGTATREQVAEASSELIEKYGLENESVQLLTGSYEALTKAINEKILAQEKENYASQSGAIDTYRNQLYDEGLYNNSYNAVSGLGSDDEIIMTDEFKNSFNELLSEYNLEDVILTQGQQYGEFLAMFGSMSDQQLANFGKFQERYQQLLANTLKKQGLNPEESEVYKNLAQMVGKTESYFEGLNGAIKSARESLLEIADVEFKEKYQGQDITNRDEYSTAKDNLRTILNNEDSSLTDDELEAIIAEYFGQDSSTKGFVEADAIISKLSHFSENEKEQISAYSDYDSGKITAEEFVRQLGLIDFDGLKVNDINNLVTTNQFKSAVSAPQDFLSASSGISGYINENYTMEGINQTELDGFRAYLSSISSLLPSNINAIEMWDQALQQGTMGVSNFLVQIQHLLSTQSLMVSETVLNNKAYGIAGTDAEIKQDSATWNSEKVSEAQKKEILVRYQFTFEGDNSAYDSFADAAKAFEEKLEFYNKDYEKQIEQITEKIGAAKTTYEETVKKKTGDIDSKISEKKLDIGELKKENKEIAADSNKLGFVKEWEIKVNDANIKNLQKEITELENKKINLEVEDDDVIAAKQNLEDAKAEMNAIEEKKAVKFQIEVENAMADAEQITTLRTQLAQLKELCDNGFEVDLSTFEQMRQICPAIADDVKVLSDGTLDVSAGMEALNAQLAEQIGVKGENAKATLELAVAEENALQAKLQAAIDAIDAELAAMGESNEAKEKASAATNAALSKLTEDGCLDRAKLFEQEAKDQGDAAVMGAQTVINTVDAMDNAYQRFGGTLDKIHLKMKNLGENTYTSGMSAANVQAAKNKLVKDTSFTADAGNYDGKDIEEYLKDVSETTDGAERKKKLEETKAMLQALKDKSIAREGDYQSAKSALSGGGNNYGVKDDDKKGKSGSSGNKDKNTTNTKLKNIEQQLEDLERKRKKGDINALEYQTRRNQLLTTKHGLLEASLNSKLAQSKGAVYYDKKSDSIKYNSKIFNSLSDKDKDAADKIYEETKKICEDMNKIEDEVGSIERVTNDTTNEDQKLEALERKRKNGDISADEYERQRQGLLTSKYGKLSSEFYYQLENNPEKDFFSYDAKTDTLKLNEKKFNQIKDPKEQEEVKKQFETVDGILKEMNTIEDEIGEINEKFTNDTTNEKSTQEALDRQYERNRMGSKDYGEQTRNNLLSQQSKLQAQFSESLMKSAESAFFKYDKALDTLLIDEEKLSQLSEERAKEVLQEYETLKGINDELNGIEDQIEDLKGDRFDTNTEDVTQRGYELLYQNGDITPEVYQEKMKQSYDSENRSLKGDMNDILGDLKEEEIGAVYYDAETGEVKKNPLFDVSKLDKKELKDYKKEMKKIFDEDKGWNKEIKDIQNMTDKNKQAKAWEEFKKKYEQSEYTGYYTMNEFGQLLDDKINHGRASSTVQDAVTEKVNDYTEKWERIKSNKEAKEQLTPNKKEKELDTTNHETQLKNLERALDDERMTFIEYIEARDTILEDQMARLQAQAEDLYKRNDQFNTYFDLQKDAQTGLITGIGEVNDNFYELSEQQQEDVRNFMQQLSDIIDGIYGIKNTMDDPEYDNPEDRAIANGVEAGLWNNQLETNALDRDRQELAQYQNLIGKLPSEVQGPLNLGVIGMNMYYEGQEIQINRREQQYYEEQKALNERNAEYLGSREEVADPNSDKYYYYDSRYGYMFDEAKARRQNDDEVFAKIKEEVEGLQSTFDKLQAVAQELSGGIIQKSVRTAGKSLTDLSKAFKNNERTSDNVTDAFNSLEQTLGLSDTALDKFEGTLTNIINSSGLSKKEFKGLGILDEKQTSKMKDFLTNSLGENAGNLISMIFGGGTTNGLDFTGAAMGAFGEFMNFSGSFLNFDMIGLGMDAISQSIGIGQQMYNMGKQAIDKVKQGIEKAKQMIEQVIQYIAQATQVLVDAWTNREDYLYNFLKVIEKHLQEYERLQRYSTQLEKGRLSSSQDILDNWNDQWKSLQEQLEEQTERLEQRQRELNLSRINPFALISGWDPSSDTLYENREVKFLWDIIIGLGEAFAPLGTGQFFSQLNQLYEDYDKRVQQSYEDRLEAEQALLDIEDERLELVKVGADEATEFEQKLLDSLIQKEQQAIDELSRLNEAVTEANQKLLSTLQDNLDKIRQDRENERTEEELGEKERRLAYLRQDTSGANQMEIKKLEKELDREHEDYTDTLIDQKISELEKQNELAAEQRQQQIDLLQSQLDYAEKYGLYWDAVYGMLYTIDENGKAVLNPENFDLDGNIRENSELAQLLGTFSDRMGMSTWSSVLDNEEAKRLGRYYGAFIGMNGVDGNWKNRWALEDPGANDPNYAYPMEEIPGGLRGVLSRIEIEIKKYFTNSDMGLVNTFGRIGNFFKRGVGKLIGNEEWANEQFTGYDPAHTQADTMNAIHKTEVAVVNGIKEGFNNFFGLNRKAEATGAKTTSSAKSNNTNNYGTQNYGSVTENFNFNIGTIGENINLDEMVDRVSSAIRQMFTPNVNYATKSR